MDLPAGVSETLFIPLFARAAETRSARPLLEDRKAVEMADALRPEFLRSNRRLLVDLARGRLSRKLDVTMALRARHFDRRTADFLARHPDGFVASLGCGLDSRCERAGAAARLWVDVDLPAVVELRRRFFRESARYRMHAGSVLDRAWLDALDSERGRPALFLAEGLFMYLPPDEVRALVVEIARRFPGAELVCELSNAWVVRRMRGRWMRWKFRRQLRLDESSLFRFGVADARELEAWAPGIRLAGEWSYFDEDERKLGWFRLFRRFDLVRRVQWVAWYELGRAA